MLKKWSEYDVNLIMWLVMVMRKILRSKLVLVLSTSAILSVVIIVSATAQTLLTYDQARAMLRERSDAIHAANYQLQSEREHRHSLDRMHLPTLSIGVGVLAYSSERTFDIEPLQQAIGQVVAGADELIPSSIELDYSDVSPTAALTSSWLLYSGGRTRAAQRFADASIEQAKAERTETIEHQEKQLATLYFGYLLTERILNIREAVADGVERHLHLATRFEAKGVLSKVEQMHAQVAYDEAQRNLAQARADFDITSAALRRLLRSNIPINPQTQLFVITQPLMPRDIFFAEGLKKHSQIALLQAKRQQAVEGKVVEEARWKPTVVAYGAYNLAPRDASFSDPMPLLEPDWVVGINISYPLFDRYNRRRLVSAAELKIEQVTSLQREVEMGIVTLIEKNYLSVERAREQFVLLQSNIELTQETMRLRERLFEEGLGTSLDVVDARLAAARAETERAVAAYEFVVSLLGLLEASGQLDEFSDYVGRADVHLARVEKDQ